MSTVDLHLATLNVLKLNHKISISLYDFITQGKFDYIKPGMTREEILQVFPEPDDFTIFKAEKMMQSPIWRYGNFEFHFATDQLWMIFNDYLDQLDGGDSLIVDPWIFPNRRLTLGEVLPIFMKEKIDYAIAFTHNVGEIRQTIFKSGVELSYFYDAYETSAPEDWIKWELGAINLKDKG